MWKVSVTALVTIPVAREGHQLCTCRNGTNINRHHYLSTNKQMRYVSKPGWPHSEKTVNNHITVGYNISIQRHGCEYLKTSKLLTYVK